MRQTPYFSLAAYFIHVVTHFLTYTLRTLNINVPTCYVSILSPIKLRKVVSLNADEFLKIDVEML